MLLNQSIKLGARMAEAGVYSKRVYLNSKIDLIQVESIADLIHAKSEAAARSATKSLLGPFSMYMDNYLKS